MAGVKGLLDEIAGVGRSADSGGYRRFAWTADDATLREWFAGAVGTLGLEVVEDRVGNQWAWWGDPDQTPGVVTGSHLDSVPDGGNYDGPLGVASSLAAVAVLRAEGFLPQRPIGLVNFVDEEGARFGVACSGSRVLTGALPADHALALKDSDGVSMAEALRAAGRTPEHIGRDDETLARIGTFVELHIEQGRFLADTEHAIAVGSSIWPHGRWRFDFEGQANHAGTTRLADRDDPMLSLAALISSAREIAAAQGCVATVGKVQVLPNGVNAIPSLVTAWLDARGADEAAVRRIVPLARGAGRHGRGGGVVHLRHRVRHRPGSVALASARRRTGDRHRGRPRCRRTCCAGFPLGDALRVQPDRRLALAFGTRRTGRLRSWRGRPSGRSPRAGRLTGCVRRCCPGRRSPR